MKRYDRNLIIIRAKIILREISSSFLYFLGSMFLTLMGLLLLILLLGGVVIALREDRNIVSISTSGGNNQFDLVVSNDLSVELTSSTITKLLYPPMDLNQKNYSEDDLLTISQNVLGELSDEQTESWQIRDVKYHLYDCEKGFSGYVYADYEYEFPSWTAENYNVEFHHLELIPGSDYASDSSYTYVMKRIKKDHYPAFDESFSITATQAYEIIEDNGGYQARSQEDNRYCEAIIMIDEDNNEKWHIWYTGKHGVMFEGTVDRQSGKFKKIRVKN